MPLPATSISTQIGLIPGEDHHRTEGFFNMLRISPRISPPSYRGCCGRRTAEMSRWNAWDLGLLRIWDRRRRMIWT
ncbi:hypothetical protein MUK42_37413 [Musa troglodytarum]|uniref:Uncharacterized protein n=1 Tax=Musa troglodytarum TaxID=320322 RepID=A0A9E7FJU5_9LILI|nr:hypothetical protein MUK42_37413 [Musa troglodytarum]